MAKLSRPSSNKLTKQNIVVRLNRARNGKLKKYANVSKKVIICCMTYDLIAQLYSTKIQIMDILPAEMLEQSISSSKFLKKKSSFINISVFRTLKVFILNKRHIYIIPQVIQREYS